MGKRAPDNQLLRQYTAKHPALTKLFSRESTMRFERRQAAIRQFMSELVEGVKR